MLPDATRSATTIAAVAGGTLWLMAKLFAVVFAPTPPSKWEVKRAVAESIFSVIAALIGGAFVAPAIVRYRHITAPENISLVGLVVGLLFWQSIPALSAWGQYMISKRLGKAAP